MSSAAGLEVLVADVLLVEALVMERLALGLGFGDAAFGFGLGHVTVSGKAEGARRGPLRQS
jgi:hypothetical protein